MCLVYFGLPANSHVPPSAYASSAVSTACVHVLRSPMHSHREHLRSQACIYRVTCSSHLVKVRQWLTWMSFCTSGSNQTGCSYGVSFVSKVPFLIMYIYTTDHLIYHLHMHTLHHYTCTTDHYAHHHYACTAIMHSYCQHASGVLLRILLEVHLLPQRHPWRCRSFHDLDIVMH